MRTPPQTTSSVGALHPAPQISMLMSKTRGQICEIYSAQTTPSRSDTSTGRIHTTLKLGGPGGKSCGAQSSIDAWRDLRNLFRQQSPNPSPMADNSATAKSVPPPNSPKLRARDCNSRCKHTDMELPALHLHLLTTWRPRPTPTLPLTRTAVCPSSTQRTWGQTTASARARLHVHGQCMGLPVLPPPTHHSAPAPPLTQPL